MHPQTRDWKVYLFLTAIVLLPSTCRLATPSRLAQFVQSVVARPSPTPLISPPPAADTSDLSPAATDTPDLVFTATPADLELPSPTATPTATPTPSPTATPTATLVPVSAMADTAGTPPPAETRYVITEELIADQLAAGIGDGQLQYENLRVRFRADERIEVTATFIKYGFIAIRNLYMVGVLEAQNCQPTLKIERLDPGGLLTAAIPGLLNQVIARYSAGYCVQKVVITDGQIELTIAQPR